MPSTAWFEELFGLEESTGSLSSWRATRNAFVYDAGLGTLKAKENGSGTSRCFQAGWFSTPSLGDARKRVGKLSSRRVRKALPGHLRVTEVVGDVSEMHTQSENAFALFQAASQLNCLEFTSHNGSPEDGVALYAFDRTQGPACATACAPGTVVRNYFADLTKACTLRRPSLLGQTTNNQVENFREAEILLNNDTEGFFDIQSGYVLRGSGGEEALATLSERLSVDSKLRDALRSLVHIGVQKDTEVTGSKFGAAQYDGDTLLVTQAYCSALSIAYSGISAESWEPLARLILEAAYEATMLAAVENAMAHPSEPGARKVFLTVLGGGVFGNPLEWITAAMDRAFAQFAEVGLDVYIVSFGRSDPNVKALERTPSVGSIEQRSAATLKRPASFHSSSEVKALDRTSRVGQGKKGAVGASKRRSRSLPRANSGKRRPAKISERVPRAAGVRKRPAGFIKGASADVALKRPARRCV